MRSFLTKLGISLVLAAGVFFVIQSVGFDALVSGVSAVSSTSLWVIGGIVGFLAAFLILAVTIAVVLRTTHPHSTRKKREQARLDEKAGKVAAPAETETPKSTAGSGKAGQNTLLSYLKPLGVVTAIIIVSLLLWQLITFLPTLITSAGGWRISTILGWLGPGLAIVFLVWVFGQVFGQEKTRKVALMSAATLLVLAVIMWSQGYPISSRSLWSVAEAPKPPLASLPISEWPKMDMGPLGLSDPIPIPFPDKKDGGKLWSLATCGERYVAIYYLTNGTECDFKTCPQNAEILWAKIQNLAKTFNRVSYAFCNNPNKAECLKSCPVT